MDRREIPAPQLRETASIWWDSGHDPVIRWDASGRRFWLVDGAAGDAGEARLTLLVIQSDDPPAAAPVIAAALRDGLAACDFPPTDPGVPAARAAATLRAAGMRL